MGTVVPPLRVAGFILVVGVAIGLVGVAVELSMDGVGTADRSTWVAARLALLVGLALALLASPALYARQHQELGLAGMLGFGLFFLGTLGGVVFGTEAQALLVPWVYDRGSCDLGCHLLASDGPPLIGPFMLATGLMTGVGLTAFGLASARARVFPALAGFLLSAGGVLLLASVALPGDLAVPAGQLAEALSFLAVARMGWSLAREDREPIPAAAHARR